MDQHRENYNDYSNSNSYEKQFHRSESIPHITNRIVEMLDHIEHRVEIFRDSAAGLESEKEDLITVLTSIKSNKDLNFASDGEKEEIDLTTQRLLNRTQTVEVSVSTPRNEIQQKALDNVNKYFDELNENLKSDSLSLKENVKLISSYLNACLSDCKGPVHQKFQSAVLECTADDQKRMRKKLEYMINSLPLQ